MTKQTAISPEGGTSGACSKGEAPVLGGFDLLIRELKTQFVEFRTEDTVLIGNCPQDVTEEEINKFFCGFATIVRLQQVTHKPLTTKVFIAKFDSTDSASRSKVLNTLSLNGKKILLLQPDEKHFVDKKNVVELNGLQEHTEEVIYDHMTTFGNVSFVLKTSAVTYVVFEEPSAVEASCRCDYLDQYPVTIRSVLDGPAGASIETCILEQIDQNSSLLAEGEEEGQINNFMQLLDMENLDDYLEADEKDKSAGSDKPLLEVGNEEIIVTEEEEAAEDVPDGEAEADVAAIEEQALQSRKKKSAEMVSVDDRTKKILNLAGNLLRLDDLPQLKVAVRKVSKPKKMGPKKSSAAKPTGESEVVSKDKQKKKKKEDVRAEQKDGKDKKPVKKEGSAVTADQPKKIEESEMSESKTKERDEKRPDVAKKKKDKHHVGEKAITKDNAKEDQAKTLEKSKKKSNEKQATVAVEGAGETKDVCKPAEVSIKQEDRQENIKESSKSLDKHPKKKKEVKVDKEKSQPSKSETAKAISEKKSDTIVPKNEQQQVNKKVFVQLTKLSPQEIEKLSTIRRESAAGQIKAENVPVDSEKKSEGDASVKKKKPGPDKAAMRKHQDSKKAAADEETRKKSVKRNRSDDESESPSKSVAADQEVSKAPEKIAENESTPKKKKKLKLEKSAEKEKSAPAEAAEVLQKVESALSVTSADKPSEEQPEKDAKPKAGENDQNTTSDQKQIPEESIASSESSVKISESVPDICNTVEIGQVESTVDMESDEEQPLVIDEPPEEMVVKQFTEEKTLERICVVLDAKSAILLKGKTHSENLLFVDVLPRLVVKVKRVTASDYNVTRAKDQAKKSSDHHSDHHHAAKPPKKVAFDDSSIKKKEEKVEKPRKTNLDRFDSKFLPAGSKLKSKVKSKTDINHKKHLPVPDLPITLKTHLNTSFKIPKKNSTVTSASIDRNASELNCLHKESTDQDDQRKRYQKERKPRDNNKGRDWKQKRPDTSGPPAEREPSPVVDYFDPAMDDHSPSPQRIPPTPPTQSDPASTPATGPPNRNENRRFEGQNRGNNKPTFQEIWNIPQKKPEVWAKPPWEAPNAVAPNTLNSGDTWDSEPIQQPLREQNNQQNRSFDTRDGWSPGGPKARAPQQQQQQQQQKNTIDSGESWSPGGAVDRRPAQTMDHGGAWSPGPSKRNTGQKLPRDSSFDRSGPPRQQGNTISTGDMWDDGDVLPPPRKQPSPLRTSSQDRPQNPLLGGETWDDDDQEPSFIATLDRSPSADRRRLNQSPSRQRRSRSRSPGRRRRSADRSPIGRNRAGPTLSPDRRNFRRSRSRDRSPIWRKRSRSRSPQQQRRPSLDRWVRGASRSPDRIYPARDRSPFGSRRWSRSPPGRRRGSPFRGSPGRAPFGSRRSCSPPRAGLALSSADIWDTNRLSPRRVSPNRGAPRNVLLSGGNWDDDIVPLRERSYGSPPRLRDSLPDRRARDERFGPDRISPYLERRRSRSRDRDRPFSERREPSFDRMLLFGSSSRRRSRDRSPDRRKRSRSRSPGRWRHSMERSPVRRRRSVDEGSPTYQRTLDYWKAVEDQEMGNLSPERPSLGRVESPSRSPDLLDSGDRSWSPPVPRVTEMERRNRSRIDSDELWANDPKPKYRSKVGGTYSPSTALDAISSEDECDFANSQRDSKKKFDTIPLKLPVRTQSPLIKLDELSVATVSGLDKDREASRDSFDSIPSYKELDPTTLEKKPSSPNKEQLEPLESTSRASIRTDPVPENPSPEPHVALDEKKSVLENLKQRAERLKKLEEMKLARQKLLAQIKQKHGANVPPTPEAEPKHPETAVHPQIQSPNRSFEKTPIQPEAEPVVQSLKVVPPSVLLSTVNAILSNVDSLLNKPPVPEPEMAPAPLPQVAPIPVCPPLPPVPAPPIPPLPADAPPPPPPDEPPPPEPPVEPFTNTGMPLSSISWEPTPAFAPPMLPVDVSQPPPQLLNPLLQPMEPPPQQEDEQPFDEYSIMHQEVEASMSQMPPASFIDRFRRPEPNRRPNFNFPPGNDQLNVAPPEDDEFIRKDFHFNGRNFQQGGNRDPRQQNRQQQQHQHPQQRFGGNRQHDQQNQMQRDPRQNHSGNIYGGNRGRGGGRFNRNPGNNFNNNQGNRFNNFNNNAGNNFNNNPGNNFNNNPGNRFNNNNRRNNFNDNFGDNCGNFNDNFNCDSGNNFDDNSSNNFNDDSGNNFNDVSGNNFNDDAGNNFNDDSGNNFNDDFGNNFNNNPGNNFNNNGNRFNNNQQQRFNFQRQQNQRFNNNQNNNRFNNQQQQRFRQQMMQQQQQNQQEMFNEGCYDMNNTDGGYDGDANWDDME